MRDDDGFLAASKALSGFSTHVLADASVFETPGLPTKGLLCCRKACLPCAVKKDVSIVVRVHASALLSRASVISIEKTTVPTSVRPGKQRVPAALKSETQESRRREIKLLVDNNGASPGAMFQKRLDFLKANVYELRHELGWCVEATMTVLAMTSHEMYGAHGPYNPPLVDVLALRVHRLRGNRKERGLPSFEAIRGYRCCLNECCYDLPLRAMEVLWTKYSKCSTLHEENDVVAAAMWCDALGRSSQLCQTYLTAITGISYNRYYSLRCLVLRFEGCGVLSPHGNAGKEPHNLTPLSIVDKMIGVLDMYCRADPVNNQLISCNENFAGVAGLLRAMALNESAAYQQISDSTARRIIERVLRNRCLVGICKVCLHAYFCSHRATRVSVR